MTTVLENARAHFSKKKTLEVPEWQTTIFWTSINGPEKDRLGRLAKQEGLGDADFEIRVLIEKAEDADGKKLFGKEDLMALTAGVDMLVVSRVVKAMTTPLAAEQAEKN